MKRRIERNTQNQRIMYRWLMRKKNKGTPFIVQIANAHAIRRATQ